MQTRLCRKCAIEKPLSEFYTTSNKHWCRPCFRAYIMEWRKLNPKKHAAHRAVQYALKVGTLKRPELCEKCGDETYTIAHHPDYSKPMKVAWLCDACHIRLHRENGKLGGRPKKRKRRKPNAKADARRVEQPKEQHGL